MKNQGVWILKVIVLVLCVFVVGYMGYHIVAAFIEPVRTVTAVYVETEDAVAVSGIVARDEIRITLPDGFLRAAVPDGERVRRGQVVAVTYNNAQALAAGDSLREARTNLSLLYYLSGHTLTVSDSVTLQALIVDNLLGLRNSVDTGNLADASQKSLDVRSALFRRAFILGDATDLEARIAQAEARIADWEAQVARVSSTHTAPVAGLFSSYSDGLESVWLPSGSAELTPETYRAALMQSPLPLTGNAGKMVVGQSYQYIFVLPETQARRLASTVTVRFTDAVSRTTLTLTKVSVSPAQNGECVVVLESTRYLPRFVNTRRRDAEILFAHHSGLRVPRDAVRVDETGATYVFCRVLGQVVRKNVSIILEVERENYYLVTYDASSARRLLPGDEVITVGKDLFDGKVLE